MRKRRLALGVAVGCVGSGVLAALAVGAMSNRHEAASKGTIPIAYAPVMTARGRLVSPAVALSTVWRRMSGSSVASAEFGPPPDGVAPDRAALSWLHEVVRVPSLDAASVMSLWEADLLEGAVVELFGSSPDAHDDLGGATFDVQLPSGALIPNYDGGLGDVAVGQIFDRAPDEAVIPVIREVLDRYGLVPERIQVLHPLGPAPAVVASAPDPQMAAEDYAALIKDLFGSRSGYERYEGYYIDLEDSAGNSIVTASASFRTGAGRCWVAPAYRSVATLQCGDPVPTG